MIVSPAQWFSIQEALLSSKVSLKRLKQTLCKHNYRFLYLMTFFIYYIVSPATTKVPTTTTTQPPTTTTQPPPSPTTQTTPTVNPSLQGFCNGRDDGNFENPHRCDQFLSCVGGRVLYVRDCPVGLYYNEKIDQCDWPRNVDCPSKCLTLSWNRVFKVQWLSLPCIGIQLQLATPLHYITSHNNTS